MSRELARTLARRLVHSPMMAQGWWMVTPTNLVRTAYAVCACEPDTDFTFVLDLILDGAQKLKRQS
jgi:hypothetical protein